MALEIAFENGRIFNFKGLVTLPLTLILDQVILHTVVHHSSTSTKFHWNRRNLLWTYIRKHVRTDGHLRPALLGRLCRSVDLKREINDVQRSYKNLCQFSNSYYFLKSTFSSFVLHVLSFGLHILVSPPSSNYTLISSVFVPHAFMIWIKDSTGNVCWRIGQWNRQHRSEFVA